jgi:hypothetical protein
MIILAATVAMAAVPAAADAQGRGHGRGHGNPHATGNRHIVGHCPPGLASRNPPCVPPGQARRHLYQVGQRLPVDFRDLIGFGGLPRDLRDEYDIPRGYRYIYRDNSVYVVDPTTRLVRDVIDILAR